MNLTETLSTNFNNYRTNLQALDSFRNHILPDQVRAYRGVLERRQLDQNAAFSDLFGAQQTLATFVTTYLGVLGTLWSSSVNVADMLQTDDIFQLAQPQAVPSLPDLGVLLPFPCCHPSAPGEPIIHYETSANTPRSLLAAVPPAAPPTMQPQPSSSTGIRELANSGEPVAVATFGAVPGPTSSPSTNTGGHVVAPVPSQTVEKPFEPLTFETHTAN
jgi:hypothetical protein